MRQARHVAEGGLVRAGVGVGRGPAPMSACATVGHTMHERAGRTVKLSISLPKEDYELLKKRAKRAAEGNVSAAIVEVLRIAEEHEGREALGAWLREKHGPPSAEEIAAALAEWYGEPAAAKPKPKAKKRSKAA